MAETVIKCRKISKGKASGEALVSSQPMAFYGTVDPDSGVVGANHELCSAIVTGKILVFPVGKGSAGSSYFLARMACSGTAPAAIINRRADPILAVSSIIGNIPMVVVTEVDPIELIKTGDFVEVDADASIIRVKQNTQGIL